MKPLTRYSIVNYYEKVILYDYVGKRVLKTIYYITLRDEDDDVEQLNKLCNRLNESYTEDLHYLENVQDYITNIK